MANPAQSNRTHLVVMQGDGIGPEITAATIRVLGEVDRLLKLGLSFEEASIGLAALKAQGTTMPEASFEAAKRADGVILGPVSHNVYPPADQGGINPSGALRKRLDLYANVRPAKTPPGMAPRIPGKPVDLVVMRENTEGFYADRNMYMGNGEFMPTPDVALAVRKITRIGSTRIAEAGFKLAMQRPRRKVTVVHKANVLRAVGRAVPGMHARGRGALSAGRMRGTDHGRDGRAAGARRQPLRRHRHHQRVRRHPVRRSLRDRRQPRPRRLDQPR